MSTQDLVAVLLFVAAFAVVLLAMAGLFMKWSLRWTGAGNYSFFYTTAIILVALLLSAGLSTGLQIGFPDQPWYVYPIYSLATWILVICVMAKCDPLTAFGAYVIQSFLSCFAFTGVMLATFVALTLAAPGIVQRTRHVTEKLATTGRWSTTTESVSSDWSADGGNAVANEPADNPWAAWTATSAAGTTPAIDSAHEETEQRPAPVLPKQRVTPPASAVDSKSAEMSKPKANWPPAAPTTSRQSSSSGATDRRQEPPKFQWQGVPVETDAASTSSSKGKRPSGGVRQNPFVN